MIRPVVRAASAALLEIGWVGAHAATYPLGLLRERGDHPHQRLFTPARLSPGRRSLINADVRAATTPIVLVHGIVDNRTIFALLRRGLRRRGFSRIRTFSYAPNTNDVPATAERFGAFVEALCEETGSEVVHVVGHSLGGLIARYYVQRLGGGSRVQTLVTLGTPHAGTLAARLLPYRLVRQLRPGSDVLRSLQEPVSHCATRFLVFYSDIDQLIVPARNARLTHPDLDVTNVLVHGVGHMSLPINGRIVHQICTALATVSELSDAAAGEVGRLAEPAHDHEPAAAERLLHRS